MNPRSTNSPSAAPWEISDPRERVLKRNPRIWLGVALLLGITCAASSGATGSDPAYVPLPKGTITFNSHIAAVIHQRCAPCHHPGSPAPFDLLTFQDVQKRLKLVLEVTGKRQMPPWLPEPGFAEFAGERRLTAGELGMLQQWAAEGAAEGPPGTAPKSPEWPEGWLLGKPDLVLKMDRPYILGPEGPDVYRNFVIPVSLEKDRFVRALEILPGNPRAVHHAFVLLDESASYRREDRREATPGFPGMSSRARMPAGPFLGWQPGKVPFMPPDSLSWRLPKTNDLIVQLHLNRTGKPEPVQTMLGLHFTETPPLDTNIKFKLTSLSLDFPAGASNAVVTDSFTLPVDADFLAVNPHAHYLAREMQGWAILPDGTKKWMLWIKQWNFNWQGEYRYAQPVSLPKGTTLHLQYTYDNSTNNVRNPNRSPKRVVYGDQSSDEMCELWFQIVLRQSADRPLFEQAQGEHLRQLYLHSLEQRVRVGPNEAEAMTQLGTIYLSKGDKREGWRLIEEAIRVAPELAEAHLNKGAMLRLTGRFAQARPELELAVRLDPKNAKAHSQLGLVLFSLGKRAEAELSFQKALDLDPKERDALGALEEIRQRKRQ